MIRDGDGSAGFERRLHGLLEESVARVGGHARSRLNQARHAAVAEAARPRRWRLPRLFMTGVGRRGLWMPAAGAVAAALLVAFLMWPHAPRGYPAAEASRARAEDLELLADGDGMDLMQSGDGQFYEWAMAQADKSGPAGGDGSQDKAHAGGDGGADQNSG
jgi:hypothetical protein